MSKSNRPKLATEQSQPGDRLLVHVAWMHAVLDMTQASIAEQLGLSRPKVNRLIHEAKETGVIEARVDTSRAHNFELERALVERFDLRDAVVVMEAREEGKTLYYALAQGFSDWIEPRLQPDLKIAMGRGRTLSHLPLVLTPRVRVPVQVCEIAGGTMDESGLVESFNVTERFAKVLGGTANYIYAPSHVANKQIRDALLNEPVIMEALRRACECEIVVQSVGTADEDSILYKFGYLSDEDLATLRQAGAVGEMMSYFYDANGRVVPSPLEDRIVGITLGDSLRIPWRVCLAGGRSKLTAISAAIENKLFNVLVTDAATASKLLEA